MSKKAERIMSVGIKTEVFLSSEFELEPGSVSNKYFNNIDFPRGHIAIKNFNAEVDDEKGNPIPLHETYLHHWLLLRYYYRRGFNIPNNHGYVGLQSPDHTVVKNNGVCDSELPLYFGLGAETRRTEMDVPDPYGIEVGNPEDIPEGYNEGWILNVHTIDTRGAEDKMGCSECRCDLYNVTIDEHGVVLPEGHRGGMKCCYDEAGCRVKEGLWGVKRKLYLRYMVKYVDWDASIVPVRIHILDVTETWTKARHHSSVVMDAAIETGYQPPAGFVEDKRDPLIDINLTDSTELWLIQWPSNQPPDFDGLEVSMKLNSDGHLGTFEGSSGKSYEVVSFKSQGPEAMVFLTSESEAQIAGKISRRVSLIHYPEPSELQRRNNLNFSQSQRSSAATSTMSGRRMATPTRIRPTKSQTKSGYSTPSSRNTKSSLSGPSEPPKKKRVEQQSGSTHSAQDSGRGNSVVTTTGSLEQSDERKSKKKKKSAH